MNGLDQLSTARVARATRATGVTVTAVIPAMNEAANLPHVFARIPDCVTELILVDGNSSDDTIAVARSLRPDVRIVLQSGKGKGNALACGFAAAHGDIIVMLDADGSTDPAEIPQFIAPLLEGADFAKGSRYATGGGSADITLIRDTGNKVLGGIVNLLFGTKFTDLCYGYNAFWRSCLPHMHVTCDGFEVETLINVRVARAGLNVTEVPSYEQERIHGESNLHAIRDGRRVLTTIIRERLHRKVKPADTPSTPTPSRRHARATATARRAHCCARRRQRCHLRSLGAPLGRAGRDRCRSRGSESGTAGDPDRRRPR
jgi:glycosyltransferase involved in cell wall biosynthesis